MNSSRQANAILTRETDSSRPITLEKIRVTYIRCNSWRQEDYRRERFYEVTRKTELGVKVLTTGSGRDEIEHIEVSKKLAACQDMQKLFEPEVSCGARRIAWRPDCGTAELKVQFNWAKSCCRCTMQMCILEIFNDHEMVSLRQMAKILDVEYDTCIKSLHGMIF